IEDRHTARYRHPGSDVATWLRRRDYVMHTWQDGRWEETDVVCAHTRNYLFLPGQTGERSVPQTVAASARSDGDALAPTGGRQAVSAATMAVNASSASPSSSALVSSWTG